MVGGSWKKVAAETMLEEGGALQKKFLQGSAQGQCPVVLHEADGGRRSRRSRKAQQDGRRKDNRQTGGTQNRSMSGVPEKV